jgi:hypothetical protein
MYELHGCLSQGVSVCRLSDHPLAFDAGLMEHSRRGYMLLRVRMTATVAIRWGDGRTPTLRDSDNHHDVMDVALQQ